MQVRLTIPEDQVDEQTINAALEAATVMAERQAPFVPPIRTAIKNGVRWREEPPGEERFDVPTTVLKRGWGDCDDLAPYHAGYLRASGEDPGARAIAKPSGPHRWHALVQRSNGSLEDPSKWAGMNARGGQRAPIEPPIVGVGCSGLQIRGCAGPSYIARVDMPIIGARHGFSFRESDSHPINALHKAVHTTHIVGTILNERNIGMVADPRTITMCGALDRILHGERISHVCGEAGLEPATVRAFIATARDILATIADELFSGSTWTMKNGHPVRAVKVPIEPEQSLQGGRG